MCMDWCVTDWGDRRFMRNNLSKYDHFQFIGSRTVFCFLMKASLKKNCHCQSFLLTWYESRIKEEGVSIEYLPPSDWPVGMALECFLGCWLIWEDSVHCRWCFLTQGVGLVFYQEGTLTSQKKQTRQQCSATISAPRSCLVFLPWLPWMMGCKLGTN